MQNQTHNVDVLIIGAGMAGLTAAKELQAAGRQVLVLDKGRNVGGRVASRRIGLATFDHGAQFITTRSSRFAAVIEQGRHDGAVEEWCRGFAKDADGHIRWRGKPSINAFAKYLAIGLDVRLETQIVALQRSNDRWLAESNAGEGFAAGALILTPPVPQSLALLDAGGIALSPQNRARLARLEYERCLAVMAVLERPSQMRPPGGLVPGDGPIAWIADNQLKGISAAPGVTIHATHAFSLEHWDRDREASGRRLLEAAADWLGAGVQTFQVHGWRYSKPLQLDEQPCAVLDESPPLVLAGDAFAGPRVEGAALSGWAAAEAVLSKAPNRLLNNITGPKSQRAEQL